MNLEKILGNKNFHYLKPLTQSSTLKHKIETVDITETPDVSHYTSPNAFMLTTAMIYEDNQKKLIPFIDSLININVAGLGIKTSRFLKKIDPAVIKHANNRNFALVEIPEGVTLGYVAHSLFDYILEKSNQQMIYALDIQKFYSKLVLQNATPQIILDELSKIIDTPVLLLSNFMIKQSWSSGLDESILTNDQYVQYYKNNILKHGERTYEITFRITDPNVKYSYYKIYQLPFTNMTNYYLVVFHNNDLKYPLSDFAIEQSITVLIYIIYKNSKIEESMMKMQFTFFRQLIDSKPMLSDSILEDGLKYGLINSSYYQVLVFTVLNEEENTQLSFLLYHWLISSTLLHLKHSLLFFDHYNNKSILVLQKDDPGYEKIISESLKQFDTFVDLDVMVGIGNSVNHVIDIKNSYFEASSTLKSKYKPGLHHFKTQGAHTLLNAIDDTSTQYYIQEHLQVLASHDNDFNNDLRDTLRVYLENRQEIGTTANILYLHRNTIVYRIRKLEELLNVDLEQPEVSFNLRLALVLFDKMEKNT